MTSESQPELSTTGSKFAPILESASKAITAGALLVYVCGYLITSIYHSQYGVIQNNPFRPRIVSAGAWFLLLAVIPVISVTDSMGAKRIEWLSLLRYLFPYWIACCTLSLFPAMLFTFGESGGYGFDWRQITALLIAWFAFTGFQQVKKLHRVVLPIASVSLTLFFLALSIKNLVTSQRFGYSSLVLWFFGIGLITMLELMSFEPPKLWDTRWIRTFFAGLLLLLVFAGAYYPNLRASWGGGAPVAVTIYFTKDSIIGANSEIDALLLDEEDAGLYIKGKSDMSALFVPRSSVALISFSGSNQKSQLLNTLERIPDSKIATPQPDHK